jgi:hypothetical protein
VVFVAFVVFVAHCSYRHAEAATRRWSWTGWEGGLGVGVLLVDGDGPLRGWAEEDCGRRAVSAARVDGDALAGQFVGWGRGNVNLSKQQLAKGSSQRTRKELLVRQAIQAQNGNHASGRGDRREVFARPHG